MPNQYENDANYLSHYESTGPEIWAQTNGKVSHFFTGCGTGGTITGVATYLKEKNKDVKIVAIQAQQNHLLQGLRNFEESAMPDLFKRRQEVVDHWITATNKDSFGMVRELAMRENLLVGPSSGSVMASMLEMANGLQDSIFVGLFADDGRKFKSLYIEQGIFTTSEYENLLNSARNLPSLAYQKIR
jgi:cysteine synthase B